MLSLTDVQAAYLAALIDGEGSVECQKQYQKGGRTPRYLSRLSFTMATHAALDAVAAWTKCKVKRYPTTNPKWSDRYRLHIYKSTALLVFRRCLPFFLEKRRQAEILLELEAHRIRLSPSRHHFGSLFARKMPPEWEIVAEPLYREFRSLKSNKRPST